MTLKLSKKMFSFLSSDMTSRGGKSRTSFMFDFNGVKFLAWPDRPTECNKNVEKCLKSFSDNFPG